MNQSENTSATETARYCNCSWFGEAGADDSKTTEEEPPKKFCSAIKSLFKIPAISSHLQIFPGNLYINSEEPSVSRADHRVAQVTDYKCPSVTFTQQNYCQHLLTSLRLIISNFNLGVFNGTSTLHIPR